MHPDCIAVMSSAEAFLKTENGASEARSLLDGGADLTAFIDALAAYVSPEEAAQLREELAELPVTTVTMILQAWLLAEGAGKRLTLTSVRPERPIEAARNRRVEMSIAIEEDGVTVALAHVPGAARHLVAARRRSRLAAPATPIGR